MTLFGSVRIATALWSLYNEIWTLGERTVNKKTVISLSAVALLNGSVGFSAHLLEKLYEGGCRENIRIEELVEKGFVFQDPATNEWMISTEKLQGISCSEASPFDSHEV